MRRFQNEDGTYTEAGKTRYARGKQYYNERINYELKQVDQMKARSKQYQTAKKEADRLATKYKLDRDDGGGGDHENYSQETLRYAGQKYWNHIDNMSALEEEFEKKAQQKSKEYITKKYGKTALSDIQHYNNVQTRVFLGSFAALSIGAILLRVAAKRRR